MRFHFISSAGGHVWLSIYIMIWITWNFVGGVGEKAEKQYITEGKAWDFEDLNSKAVERNLITAGFVLQV